MVTSLSELGFALYVRLVWLFHAFTWRYVHPLAWRPGAERTLLGRVAKRWLPTPSKASIAALADVVEMKGDPDLLRAAAALLQRAAAVAPKLKRHFIELATHVEELARFQPGCNQLAVQVAEELEKLLAAPKESWSSPDEVLGEAHCHPVDLLVMTWSRLLADRGDRRDLLAVMSRLRSSVDALVMADPDLAADLKRRMIHQRTHQELLLFDRRVGGSAWTVDDLAALRAGVFGDQGEGGN